MDENKPILTVSDLLKAVPREKLEELIREKKTEEADEKSFLDTIKTLEQRPSTSGSTPMSSPTVFTEEPLELDQAFSRLRIMWGALPAHQRQKMLPILVERMAKRVRPEDVEDFRSLAYSLMEESETKSDVLERYLPILLILSMMRSS